MTLAECDVKDHVTTTQSQTTTLNQDIHVTLSGQVLSTTQEHDPHDQQPYFGCRLLINHSRTPPEQFQYAHVYWLPDDTELSDQGPQVREGAQVYVEGQLVDVTQQSLVVIAQVFELNSWSPTTR